MYKVKFLLRTVEIKQHMAIIIIIIIIIIKHISRK